MRLYSKAVVGCFCTKTQPPEKHICLLAEGMAPAQITEDYYFILEVSQTATPELLNRSYKRLALKLHPDRNAKHDATQTFQLVRQF